MAGTEGRHLWRRARTAASLPGRVVACEDRTRALEAHVVTRLDEMRAELAELRLMVRAALDADADATELLGRLLQASTARLDALESALDGLGARPAGDARTPT